MDLDKKTLEIFLKFSLDQNAQAKIKSGASTIKAELKAIRDQAAKTREEMEKIQSIGMVAAGAGAAILTPFVLAADKYVSTMKASEVSSARFLAVQEKNSETVVRIGRVYVETVLPALEKAADLAEDFADFIDRNPDAIKTIIGVGTGLLVGGGVITTAAQVAKTIATLQMLAADKMLEAADKQTVAGSQMAALSTTSKAASTVASVGQKLGQVVLYATAAYIAWESAKSLVDIGLDAVNQPRIGEIAGAQWEFLKRLPEVFKGQIKLNDLAAEVIKGANAVKENRQGEIQSGADPFKEVEGLSDFINYQKQIVEAEERAADERTRIIKNAEKQRASIMEQISKEILNYAEQERQAEAEAQRERARMQADYEKESRRAAEDHALRLREIERQRDEDTQQAISDRDAYALEKANSTADEARSQENENFATEQARRREDFNQQMADLNANLAQQKAERAQAHAEQMAELKKQLEEVNKQEIEDLKAAEQNARDAARKITDAFIERMNEASKTIAGSTVAYQNYMKQKAVEFQNFMQQMAQQSAASSIMSSGSILGSMAGASSGLVASWAGMASYDIGGYSPANQVAYLHANEFVMNPGTTRAAEAAVGGRLTQAGILANLGGSGAGGRNITISVGGNFYGTSKADIPDIRSAIRSEVDAALSAVLED